MKLIITCQTKHMNG